MKKTTSILLLVIMFVGLQIQSHAQGIGYEGNRYDLFGRQLNTITTAVPFLQIAPDSRAGAMGDIGCATSADVNSQSYNPSKYVFNDNKFGISVSYSPWLRKLVSDMNLAYLSAYYKITDMDAIAFSLRYFSLGDIFFSDINGVNPLGDNVAAHPNEFSFDFTYSRKLIDELSIAITPRFIYSNLTSGYDAYSDGSKAGMAGAADLSLFYEQDFRAKGLANSTLRAGLAIQNIGNKISYTSSTSRDFLPMNLKLGIGYEMAFDDYNKLAINAEINKLLVPTNPVYQTDSLGRIIRDEAGNPIIASGKDPNVSVAEGIIHSFYDAPGGFREEMQEINFAFGAEYSYRNLFFVRAGYFHESPYKGNRQFLTAGVGIKYSVFNLDVSYLFSLNTYHPLANTLRFTLSFDFASFNKEDIKQQGRLR